MCGKIILENGGTLKSVPDCYQNQEMFNKAVDNYPHAEEFVSKCYKTQKLILFLISMKLKKCETELFLKILF